MSYDVIEFTCQLQKLILNESNLESSKISNFINCIYYFKFLQILNLNAEVSKLNFNILCRHFTS